MKQKLYSLLCNLSLGDLSEEEIAAAIALRDLLKRSMPEPVKRTRKKRSLATAGE